MPEREVSSPRPSGRFCDPLNQQKVTLRRQLRLRDVKNEGRTDYVYENKRRGTKCQPKLCTILQNRSRFCSRMHNYNGSLPSFAAHFVFPIDERVCIRGVLKPPAERKVRAPLCCNFVIACFLSKHFARLVGAGLALPILVCPRWRVGGRASPAPTRRVWLRLRRSALPPSLPPCPARPILLRYGYLGWRFSSSDASFSHGAWGGNRRLAPQRGATWHAHGQLRNFGDWFSESF
jgi:hypothetical protein